ncbi:class I SAM-dependent methyltransferase [Candidatus Parcubacteria bacterium]|nr:class I SAM-dependent methyltransferase [Patescibacteria group bacterium]MCG2688469.1 class I SAM-dependent methyltransferase [Candidatus Parcubacteria bacterium]MCG2693611.1 class I SAM-dependent methyltransferase [Candidatus Parcubacteria bacterium]
MKRKQAKQQKLKIEEGLEKAIRYAPKGVVLDIGAGEGRNSIFLAKSGFKVQAIDIDAKSLEKCKRFAKNHNLPIITSVADVRKFKFGKEKYSLVISINTLDFLRLKDTKKLITKVGYSLVPGGVFYLYGFSVKDSLLEIAKRKHLKEPEKNTFYFPKMRTPRHFFEKKELFNLCKNFEIIKLEEKKIIHTHMGSEKPHRHWIIRVIAKKERSVG